MSDLRLLALDPNTKQTGYVLFEGREMVSYGVVEGKRWERTSLALREKLMVLHIAPGIDAIVYDRVYLKRSARANVALTGMTRAMARDLYELKIEAEIWKPVSAITANKAAGRGKNMKSAERKEFLVERAEEVTGFKWPEHVAEAYWTGIAALDRREAEQATQGDSTK